MKPGMVLFTLSKWEIDYWFWLKKHHCVRNPWHWTSQKQSVLSARPFWDSCPRTFQSCLSLCVPVMPWALPVSQPSYPDFWAMKAKGTVIHTRKPLQNRLSQTKPCPGALWRPELRSLLYWYLKSHSRGARLLLYHLIHITTLISKLNRQRVTETQWAQENKIITRWSPRGQGRNSNTAHPN